MGDLPLRTPRHRRLGGPLPRQPANATHAHPRPINLSTKNDAVPRQHGILAPISRRFVPVGGRLHTRYAPVRHSCASCIATLGLTVRLACIKPAASVHPEPGSNSPSYLISFFFVCLSRPLPFSTRTCVLCTLNRLKLSRNNLSFVCYISFHSLKELARFPFASSALALAHLLPPAPFLRCAKRDCKNTPFI